MLYDLNIPWSKTIPPKDLERTLSFLSERKCAVNYSVVALNHLITGAIPSKIENPILSTAQLQTQLTCPSNLTILRRCTVTLSDPAHNHRLPALAPAYDILALRPTTEKAFLAACLTLSEHSLISLDLSIRHPFHFKPKPFMTAIKRGIRFELCYAQATQGDSSARRNLISNVLAIVRVTGGRGLVISSEARSVLGVRAPADVLNLLQVWGLGGDRASEAISVSPRSVVMNEAIKRRGYRGIIDVVEAGDQGGSQGHADAAKEKLQAADRSAETGKIGKRKNVEHGEESGTVATGAAPQISKRQAKKMRREAVTHNSNPMELAP
ncbi:MAG: hypothetical protein M1818_002071 [Claussenomyces sp. TS43310]|nr:MAG: hypothetical protein M1818_002071 [Claussenomyces sp. TS43310]